MASVEDLDRRVLVLEAKVDVLVGGQDAILGHLRDQGRVQISHGEILASHGEMLASHGEMLASHGETLASHGAKLDIIVDWIQAQPE
jgi:hypothetical protein